MPRNYSEDASNDIALNIPGLNLGALINMVAVAKRVFCEGEAGDHAGTRRAAFFMEQLVYEQAYDKAGADEIWRDPVDGSFHHPTFPEQQGEAWEVMKRYDDEVFALRLIELASDVLARRDPEAGQTLDQRRDYYEHLLQDILEAEGVEGVMRNLIT